MEKKSAKITFAPKIAREVEEIIYLNGEEIGTIFPYTGTSAKYQASIRMPHYGIIGGFGDDKESAIRDALVRGKIQTDAMLARIKELGEEIGQ